MSAAQGGGSHHFGADLNGTFIGKIGIVLVLLSVTSMLVVLPVGQLGAAFFLLLLGTLGFFMMVAFRGVEASADGTQWRTYSRYFGVHLGAWRSAKNLETVLLARERIGIRRRVGASTYGQQHTTFEVQLRSKGEEDLVLFETTDYKKGQLHLIGVGKVLGLPIRDLYGEHRKRQLKKPRR